MDYLIREMKPFEYFLLEKFLYKAIFQRDGEEPLDRKIIYESSLYKYIENFGEYKDDYCLCADIDNQIVGACWVRNINGYVNIDESTPEFSISILPEYRGIGIGRALMEEMLKLLRREGYTRVSLSVQKENYAKNLYLSLGFKSTAKMRKIIYWYMN